MMDQNTTAKKSKVIRFGKFRYLAAGGILVLILAMCFMPVGGGSLFTALEDKISETLDIFSVRSAGGADAESASIAALQECMKLYNEQEYAEAVPAFERFISSYSESDNIKEAKLYLSVSYIYNSQAETANTLLKELVADEDFRMQEDAIWNLGLSYVFLREMEKAKATFGQLTESEVYAERAEAMLKAKDGPQGDNVVFK